MSAPRSPSGEAGRAYLALATLVAATLALRLILAARVHLAEDEAYYRLWSLAPALGYFDHPPMIAWWIAAGRALAGDSALGVRLLPCLSCAAATLVLWLAVREAGGGARQAWLAALFFNATFLVGAGGLLATPDSPASLFWIGAIAAALAAGRPGREGWWLAAGACAGLAALSKYSRLFLAPGLGLWLVLRPEGRAALARPWPWLGAALALAIFSLNLAWNAGHGWETFAKQFGRVTDGGISPRFLPELLAGQFLLANPLIALLAIRGGRAGGWARPFLATSAPFALYLLVHALHARVEGHWAAPLHAPLAALAARGADGAGAVWRRIARLAPILGLAAILAAYAWLLSPAVPWGADPARPLRAWPAFGKQVEQVRVAAGAGWIGTVSYGTTAQLADERAEPIAELQERARWRDLPMPRVDPARPGLVVDLARRVDPSRLLRCFAFVRPLHPLTRDGVAYAAIMVAGARVDLERTGCPP